MHWELLLAGAAVLFAPLAGCSESAAGGGGESWTGVVYSDRAFNGERRIGPYATEAECRDAAEAEVQPGGIWECGLNCRAEGDMLVCERTVD